MLWKQLTAQSSQVEVLLAFQSDLSFYKKEIKFFKIFFQFSVNFMQMKTLPLYQLSHLSLLIISNNIEIDIQRHGYYIQIK